MPSADGPSTLAGRELLQRHADLAADEVIEVERQSRGQETHAAMERRERLVDALRHLLTPDQLGAVTAVLALDPDLVATLDDEKMRLVLSGLSAFSPDPDPEARRAAREASRRFLDEIM
jgi:hypothetical protein